jgi:hypothetical protein
MRQRKPRIRDQGYLAWLRTQRCACGCLRGPPCDAAHLRASSHKHDKPITGIGQKPDDKWALPLRRTCHMSQHAYGDEVGWWAHHGAHDPFALALRFYARYRRVSE